MPLLLLLTAESYHSLMYFYLQRSVAEIDLAKLVFSSLLSLCVCVCVCVRVRVRVDKATTSAVSSCSVSTSILDLRA